MKLTPVVDTLDEVEEQYRPLYEERDDGKFRLTLEVEPSEDDKKRVAEAARKEREARQAAERRAKEAEESLKRFEGIDPDKVRELLAKQEEEDHDEARKKGEWDEVLRKKDERAAEDLRKAVEPRDARIAELEAENDALVTERDLSRAAEKLNVDPKKAEIWRDHIRTKMRMEKSGENGQQMRRNVVDVDDVAMDFLEWAEKHWSQTDAAQFFILERDNAGGDAPGSGDRSRNVRNPWKRDHFNRTEQSRIAIENPALAKRLKQEAGYTVN